jgi:hypothetical protein
MKKYKLSSVLKRLQEEQRSGTLLCVGEDNVMGRIYFVEGKPRAARCRNFQGKDALLRINENLLVSLKFHKDVNLVKSQSAINIVEDPAARDTTESTEPATDDVSAIEFKSMLDIAALTGIDEDTTRLDVKLTDESRRILAEELVEFLGPVAQMIVSDLDGEISIRDALNLLAQEIGDMDSAIQFVEKIKLEI